MSDAEIGYGLTFSMKASVAATDLTELTGVFSVTPPAVTVDAIDVTHYKSPGRKREYMPGLGDNGTVTAEMNYIPGSATDLLILGLISSGDIVPAEVEYENGTKVEFTCFVVEYTTDIPLGEKLAASLGLQVTGEVTVTPGAGV